MTNDGPLGGKLSAGGNAYLTASAAHDNAPVLWSNR